MAFQSSNQIQLDKLLAGNGDQLLKLLDHSFPADTEEHQQKISTEQLIKLLKNCDVNSDNSLIKSIQGVLSPEETFSQQDFSILSFTDQLFLSLSQQNSLDKALSTQLNKLAPACACNLLTDINGLWNTEHPLYTGITAIHKFAIGWHPNKTRAADKFFPKLEQLISELSQANDDTIELASKNILSFFESEQKRTEKLEQRLRASEFGSLRAKHAQQKSTRILNKKMTGKQLPAEISQFIKTHWRDSLILLLIQVGEESNEWHKALQVSDSLINSFQNLAGNDESQQAIYDMISGINDDLRELTRSLSHDEDKLNHELAIIDQHHLNILKGGTPHCESFEPIDNTNPLNTTNTTVSSRLLEQTEKYSEGQWFISKNENNNPHRIRLILKLDDIQQVLFSNRLGIKAEQFGFEEFAYKLSTKTLIPIRLTAQPRAAGMLLVTKLYENYNNRKRKVTDLKAELKKVKDAAKAKALKEAEELKQLEKTPSPKKETLSADINVEEKALYDKFTKLLSNISIGTKIIFQDKEGSAETCKLAVKLQSTGKYIFVTKAGIKKYEVSHINLLNQLITGKAKLPETITRAPPLPDPLTQVVNSLRQENR